MKAALRILLLALVGFTTSAFAADEPFGQALDEIVGRSPDIATQRETLESTRAASLPAHFVLAPELSVDALSTTQRVNAVSEQGTTRQAEVKANLNLLRFGADMANLHSANAEIRRQEALLGSTELKSEQDGSQALVDLIQRRLDRQVLERSAGMENEALDIARRRYEHGLLAQQEVDKVEVDLENARSRLADGQVSEATAEATLRVLLGHADIRIEWPWKDKLTSLNAASFVSAHPFDVNELPDWRAAHELVESREELSLRYYRLMLPSLDTSFTYGYYDTNNLSVLGFSSGSQWTFTAGVTFPIFDRLVNYSSARSNAHLRSAAEASQVLEERQALGTYETQRRSFEISVVSAVARERTLAIARRIYRDSLLRFKSGRATSNDLLLDEGRLTQAETLADQGWASAHMATVGFCHSLGRRIAGCF